MPAPSPGQRAARIWAASAVVVVSLLLTLTRLPTSHADGPFYASIVRGAHYGAYGVPASLQPDSPTAINHIRFYGPVYFTLVDLSFRLFGISAWSYRVVSLIGGLLAAAGGVWICKVLGGGPERRAWTWALLLLTPEIGTASSSGRMDSLAVGIELWGLAIFLDGLVRRRRPALYGAASAVLLCAAVLTTPRTFPFMFGFALALAFVLPGEIRRAPAVARQAAITIGVGVALILTWTIVSSGSPQRWFRLMATVATREDSDVAILPTAGHRDLMFVWWQSITLAFSIAGGVIAAVLFRRDRSERGIAVTFGLVATWTALVVTMTLFNFTFLFGIYSVIPLTALVIAVPVPLSALRRRGAALAAVMLFGLLAGVRVAKVTHAAITWDGRDLGRVDAFIARNVPPGSRVLGPGHDYVLSVERAGSRYLAVPQVSLADWARWMQIVEPRELHPSPLTGDFLLWRASDGQPPRALACPGELVDTYEPPPPTLPSLEWVVDDDPFAAYPKLHLYALNGRCGV